VAWWAVDGGCSKSESVLTEELWARRKRFMLCWLEPKGFGIRDITRGVRDGSAGVAVEVLSSSSESRAVL